MRYSLSLTKILIPSLLLVACTPLPPKHEVSYSVACTVDTKYHKEYSYKHIPAAVDTQGQAEQQAPQGTFLVGYTNDWESSGLNHRYLGFAYRGYVFFDRNALPSKGLVLDAALHFNAPSTVIWQGDTASNENASAASKFYVLTKEFSGFYSEGDLHVGDLPHYTGTTINASYDQSSQLVIDVTMIVRDIVLDKRPNYGFMLVGLNESFSHNNDQFMSTYEAPVLVIRVLEDVPTWPETP